MSSLPELRPLGQRVADRASESLAAAQRRALRPVHHGAAGEPESLTDARARVDLRLLPSSDRTRRLKSTVPAVLVLTDIVALALSSKIVGPGSISPLVLGLLVLLSRGAARQYRPRLVLSALDDVPRALTSTLVGMGLTVPVTLAIWGGPLPESELLRRAGWFLALSTVLQVAALWLARRARARLSRGRRTLIVGAGRVGAGLARTLLAHPELGLLPVGFTDPDPSALTAHEPLPLQLLSTDLATLARVIIEHDIDTAILAFSGTREAQVVDTVITAHQTGCAVLVVPRMFELHNDGVNVERVRGIPLLRLRPDPTLRPSWWIKRAVDVLVAFVALVLLAVPLALIGLAVLIDSGRPVLFWQERVGLDGQTFRLCKFRSLRPASEVESQTMWTVAADPRLGRLGKILRRTSLDEVPQLWNILRGHMSLVGPRPERPAFVQQFSSEHERYWARHRVPVGLTGLAQVNGLRGDTSIRERARYDNYYIANWSLWLDLKIALLTVREVLGGHGR